MIVRDRLCRLVAHSGILRSRVVGDSCNEGGPQHAKTYNQFDWYSIGPPWENIFHALLRQQIKSAED